jgi:gamma-glutamylcyclotransferase (GGCT)/AIG2-like uncharacterized protein YtfP
MNLFTYGTLMWPEVMKAVSGRRPAGEDAVLAGYRRLRVKGEVYPVIVPSADDSVEGLLYRGLDEEALRRLDRFEGEEYERVEVQVGAETAYAYVLSKHCRHIAEDTPWQPEQLAPEHIAAFCSDYKGWLDL